MNSDTPESRWHSEYLRASDRAIQLERERDSYRDKFFSHPAIIAVHSERDQLRKVCDELYEGIGCGCGGEYGLCNRCCEIGAAYNQLPHVKDKTK